jgi:hypothetical protein
MTEKYLVRGADAVAFPLLISNTNRRSCVF